MNWTQIESKWAQVKGEAKTQWAKLTDDDLSFVGGEKDKLVGKLQERYGLLKERAQKDVDEWIDRVGARIDHVGDKRPQS